MVEPAQSGVVGLALVHRWPLVQRGEVVDDDRAAGAQQLLGVGRWALLAVAAVDHQQVERTLLGDQCPVSMDDLDVRYSREQSGHSLGSNRVLLDTHDPYAGPTPADEPSKTDTTARSGLADAVHRSRSQGRQQAALFDSAGRGEAQLLGQLDCCCDKGRQRSGIAVAAGTRDRHPANLVATRSAADQGRQRPLGNAATNGQTGSHQTGDHQPRSSHRTYS